jgi:DHA1 family bicyclomycin/chloramphenicol resistance-like MFS transporter
MTSGSLSRPPGYRVRAGEFLALIAALSALNAIAIDVMLPAFGALREAFGLAPTATDVSLIVTVYIVGLGVGQYLYGPIADARGRKPVLYVGLVLYLLGAIGAILSPSLQFMLVSRFVWGLGAAGPRVVSLAIVRDRYSGDDMARVMSIVISVFMLVPAVAPTVGHALLGLGSWRYPFAFTFLFGAGVGLWSLRLRETLPPERRRSMAPRAVLASTREVLRHRTTMGMTLAMTFALGAFFPYLGSSQLIYDGVYDREEQFPYWFGLTALIMGAASVVNSRLVRRVGAASTLTATMIVYLGVSAVYVGVASATDGRPAFALYFALTAVLLSGHVVLTSIMNSMAMDDVGHVAGTASALLGTITFVGGSLLGSLVDRTVSNSVVPLAVGYLGYGTLAAACAIWATRGRPAPAEPAP